MPSKTTSKKSAGKPAAKVESKAKPRETVRVSIGRDVPFNRARTQAANVASVPVRSIEEGKHTAKA